MLSCFFMGESRTLLLTDVVGSTELGAALGDAGMAALWTAHDRVARDLLERWSGREIDKSDGLLLLFDRVADALGYAVDYHRALATLDVPLKARAGLHTAPVLLRANSAADVARGAKPIEVEGLAKPTAARVAALAEGGQTLLTAAARATLGETRWRTQSHGYWRLKGVPEPLELFEAGGDDAPFTPPAGHAKAHRVVFREGHWLPVADVRHQLPAERDAFVGRVELLQTLACRFDEGARLVSVLGMGGAGKTRLATRFAWTALGDFPGGAWFCDLSQARDLPSIVAAVARALDVPLGSDPDPVRRLGKAIAARGACLVILDNVEQVLRPASETLSRWLDTAPAARFLVTTRELLGVPGEQTLALAPLPVPEAVKLFVQRARAARADFDAGDEHATIAPLVRLLDGLPLAIELAAARARVMAPDAVLARMGDRFRLLASSGAGRGRHATLRATLDWSWEQLADWERSALAQLSVFAGSFALEAVEAVVDLQSFETAPWAVDALQALVEKSLVRVLADDRFELFTSVREYADEHLRSPGRFAGSGPDALRAAEERHGAWYAALGDERGAEQRGAELDNLVAACRRAIARGDAVTSAAALVGAHAVRWMHGPYSAALELAESVLAMPSLAGAERARAARVRGTALGALGRTDESRDVLEESVLLARAAGDARCEARALVNLADVERGAGEFDTAHDHLETALRLSVASEDARMESECRNALGSLAIDAGEPQVAHAHYAAALTLAQRLGDRRWEGGILGNVAGVHLEQGRLDEAERCYVAAIAVAREHAHRPWEGNMVCNLGFLYLLRGEAAPARARLQSALQIARDIGHARLECVALGNLGLAEEMLGEPEAARQRLESAIELAARIDERRFEGQFRGYLGALHARSSRLAEAFASFDAGERLLRALDDGISLGVLLCARAEALARAGESARARAALDEARSLAAEAHAGAASEIGQAIEGAQRLLADENMGG